MGWLPNVYHPTSEGTFKHRFANRRPQFQNRYILGGKILIQGMNGEKRGEQALEKKNRGRVRENAV